jgi:hypothetical protein
MQVWILKALPLKIHTFAYPGRELHKVQQGDIAQQGWGCSINAESYQGLYTFCTLVSKASYPWIQLCRQNRRDQAVVKANNPT